MTLRLNERNKKVQSVKTKTFQGVRMAAWAKNTGGQNSASLRAQASL